jgi:hypothetical protein
MDGQLLNFKGLMRLSLAEEVPLLPRGGGGIEPL